LNNVHASLSDSLTREVYLLENVAIQGRKTELRQLLKLLNLAKTGQPKAALISGDEGIGKTALLKAFVKLVRDGVYCRVIDLGQMRFNSPEKLYIAIINTLRQEADQILDEALLAVNELTHELDLHWERSDLIRAVSLVKLQESIGGKEAVNQEQLLKAIRSQVPAIKRLKLSVNDKVEKLVDLLMNPWVTVATSLHHPTLEAIQDAIRICERLEAGETCEDIYGPSVTVEQVLQSQSQNETSLNDRTSSLSGSSSANKNSTLDSRAREKNQASINRALDDIPFEPELFSVEGIVSAPRPVTRRESSSAEDSSESNSFEGSDSDESVQQASITPEVVSTPQTQSRKNDDISPTPSTSLSALQYSLSNPTPKQSAHKLIKPLIDVFDYINKTINTVDTGLLIVLDEWDRLCLLDASMEERNAVKDFYIEWLTQLTERKNSHLMLAMTVRTSGESYSLGGTIYNQFRTKLLLDPLNESTCRKWNKSVFKNVTVDDSVQEKIYLLSEGSPYWQLKIYNHMLERVQSNQITVVDEAFFEKLGIDCAASILELSFTRLKLMFLNNEEVFLKAIAALINHFGERPFTATQAILELSTSQNFKESFVFEVLRTLFWHDFLRQEDGSNGKSGSKDPHYYITSRQDLSFLKSKTEAVETEISTSEKLVYLKRIIPLSIKSGDLNREKTMEILTLGEAMDHPEIVTFLEELFLEALQDERSVVRVTALNNIALIDSPRARNALFTSMHDSEEMVREYAANNLEALCDRELARKNGSPALAEQIIDVMIECLDDDSDQVRSRIYAVLSKCHSHRDLSTVFIKGLTDSSPAVRLISTRTLAEIPVESAQVFSALLSAVNDSNPDIRRYACLGLQKYPISEAIEAIMRLLKSDENSSIRALSADCLSRMEDSRAFPALVSALRNEENIEDVKLAVVRALGKRHDPRTEAVLIEALMQADSDAMPVFVWASVRSLGQVGGRPRSIELLRELRNRADNPIIVSAIDMAQHKIKGRLMELDERKQQMAQEPSVMVMLSAIQEDVPTLEEDALPL
jgi:HEAT repeat protein/Cdc6-like AAA superfamily ATPase